MKTLYITQRVKATLRKYANKLPSPLWMETPDVVDMLGKDIKLTPLGEQYPDKFKDAEVYRVNIPKYIMVDHYEQLRKEYRKGAWANCELYVMKVLLFTGVVSEPEELEIVYDVIKKHNGGVIPKRFSKDGVVGNLVRQVKQREMFLYVDEEGELKDGSQDNEIISL